MFTCPIVLWSVGSSVIRGTFVVHPDLDRVSLMVGEKCFARDDDGWLET